MAGKSLGELYVSLSARTAGFAEAMGKAADAGLNRVAKAADAIEGKSAKMAAALGDVSDGFLALGGVAAAAFAGAAAYSEPVADSLDHLKRTTGTLAVEVGEALLPALRDTETFVKRLVTAWRSLDEGTKDNVVSAIRWAAVIGPSLFALTRGIIIVKGFFEAFVVAGPILGAATKALGLFAKTAMTTSLSFSAMATGAATASSGFLASVGAMAAGFAAALAPIAAVAAAVGALVLLAGSLYDSFGFLKMEAMDAFNGIARAVEPVGKAISGFFSSLWSGFVSFVMGGVRLLMESVAQTVRNMATVFEPVARVLKQDALADTLREMQSFTGKALVDSIQEGANLLLATVTQAGAALSGAISDVGGSIAEGVSFGLSKSVSGVKGIFASASAEFRRMLPDFSGKGVAAQADPAKEKERRAREDAQISKDVSFAESLASREAAFAMEAEQREGLANFARFQDEEAQRLAQESAMADAASQARQEFYDSQIADVDSARGSWSRMMDEADAFARESAERMASAASSFGSKMLSRAGPVGGLVESAAQGAAVGGPVGAVAAVGLDLAMQSEQFGEAMEVVSGIIKTLADGLGVLIEPLMPLIGAIGVVAEALMTGLQPIFAALGDALGSFAPALMVVGIAFKALGPLFDALSFVFKPIEFAARGLFGVLKWLAIAVIDIVTMLVDAWNKVMDYVQKALNAQTSLFSSFFGDDADKILESVFGDMASGLKLGDGGLKEIRDQLANMSFPDAVDAAARAADKFASAVDKGTASLTNVPSMWKIALRRGQASNPDDPLFSRGGTVTRDWQGPTAADMALAIAHSQSAGGMQTADTWNPNPNGDGTGTVMVGGKPVTVGQITNTYDITIVASDAEEGARAMEGVLERREMNTNGNGGTGTRGGYSS